MKRENPIDLLGSGRAKVDCAVTSQTSLVWKPSAPAMDAGRNPRLRRVAHATSLRAPPAADNTGEKTPGQM